MWTSTRITTIHLKNENQFIERKKKSDEKKIDEKMRREKVKANNVTH